MGDVHFGCEHAEERILVYAGQSPAAVVDVDAAVVEIAQGFDGEDMRGEKESGPRRVRR